MSTSHYHIGWIFHQVLVSWLLDWCFHRMGFFFTCLQAKLFILCSCIICNDLLSLILVHVNFFVCFGKKCYILLGFIHTNSENFRRLKNLKVDRWIVFFFLAYFVWFFLGWKTSLLTKKKLISISRFFLKPLFSTRLLMYSMKKTPPNLQN
jgi:hypothetical protein